METNREEQYIIPARYRRMENMHIVFWLLKDISWCMVWKPIGIAMFLPTLILSAVICWRTRDIRAELAHNLAITFWICANGYWMISEFFGFDDNIILFGLTGKQMALLPFFTGAAILLYYYLVQRPREIKEHHTVTM